MRKATSILARRRHSRRHRGRRRRAAEPGSRQDRHRRRDHVRDLVRLLPPERRPGGRPWARSSPARRAATISSRSGQEGQAGRHARLWPRLFGRPDHGDRGLHPQPRGVGRAMRCLVLASLLVLLGAVDAGRAVAGMDLGSAARSRCAPIPTRCRSPAGTATFPASRSKSPERWRNSSASRCNSNWVVNTFQYRRAGCDIILDAIADRALLAEVGLRMSRPYHRSGVVLAVGPKSDVASSRRIGIGPARRRAGRLDRVDDARQARGRNLAVRVRGRHHGCARQGRGRRRRGHACRDRLVQQDPSRRACPPHFRL